MDIGPNAEVALKDTEKEQLVEKITTCPLLAAPWPRASSRSETAPLTRSRPLRTCEIWRILAAAIPETCSLFAAGNHAFMRGDSGELDKATPQGFFLLELPGSQGAHPGHSGIPGRSFGPLGPAQLPDFARLAERRRAALSSGPTWDGSSPRIRSRPEGQSVGVNVVTAFGGDLAGFVMTIGPALLSRLHGPD